MNIHRCNSVQNFQILYFILIIIFKALACDGRKITITAIKKYLLRFKFLVL